MSQPLKKHTGNARASTNKSTNTIPTPLMQMIGIPANGQTHTQVHRIGVILTPDPPPGSLTASSTLLIDLSSLNPTICLVYNPISDSYQLPGPQKHLPDFDLRLIITENIRAHTGCEVKIERYPTIFVDRWRDDNRTHEKHLCYKGHVILDDTPIPLIDDNPLHEESKESKENKETKNEDTDEDDTTSNGTNDDSKSTSTASNQTPATSVCDSSPIMSRVIPDSNTQTSTETSTRTFQPPKAFHQVWASSLPPLLTPSDPHTYFIHNLSFTSNKLFIERCYFENTRAPRLSNKAVDQDYRVRLQIHWMPLNKAVVKLMNCTPESGYYASVKARDLFFLDMYKKDLEKMWVAAKFKMGLATDLERMKKGLIKYDTVKGKELIKVNNNAGVPPAPPPPPPPHFPRRRFVRLEDAAKKDKGQSK